MALRQADIAVECMRAVMPDLDYEVVEISTVGDRDKTTPIEQLGTKAVFAHELQQALHEGRIDVAVHSTKDLTGAEPDGLCLAAFIEREDPSDVLVSRNGKTLAQLEPGSVVGTSSLRRDAMLKRLRPDLVTAPLRGNVDTRLRKVADGEVDAAVLAAAGVIRLGRADEITEYLDPARFVPPPGQGVIAIEVREGELSWLDRVDHRPTRDCVTAERAFMFVVEGSCDLPLGAWARQEGGELVLEVFVASRDGSTAFRFTTTGSDPEELGSKLGRTLLATGRFPPLT